MTVVDLKVSPSCVGSQKNVLTEWKVLSEILRVILHVEALCWHVGLWTGSLLNRHSEVLDVGALDELK